jgi:hypothetical protein
LRFFMAVHANSCANVLEFSGWCHKGLKKTYSSFLFHPPSLSLSLSLSCFLFSFHKFLFCFLLLIRPFIFCEEISVEKNHTSCRDWTPDFCVTDECLTH